MGSIPLPHEDVSQIQSTHTSHGNYLNYSLEEDEKRSVILSVADTVGPRPCHGNRAGPAATGHCHMTCVWCGRRFVQDSPYRVGATPWRWRQTVTVLRGSKYLVYRTSNTNNIFTRCMPVVKSLLGKILGPHSLSVYVKSAALSDGPWRTPTRRQPRYVFAYTQLHLFINQWPILPFLQYLFSFFYFDFWSNQTVVVGGNQSTPYSETDHTIFF